MARRPALSGMTTAMAEDGPRGWGRDVVSRTTDKSGRVRACRKGSAMQAEHETSPSARSTSAERRKACEICGSGAGTLPVELAGAGATPERAVLCDRHRRQLGDHQRRWLTQQAARSATGRSLQTGRRLRDGERMEVIRAWAQERGHQVARAG